MKKIIILCVCSIFIIYSCKEHSKKEQKKDSTAAFKSFVLKGKFKSFFTNKIYLNKIIANNYFTVDSAIVKNNTFTFSGIVEYPERFALTFENYSSALIIILENTNFEIEIDPILIQKPKITNSPLNNKLEEYKVNSKKIFKKMELLFPYFQKARLENDAYKLDEIGLKIKDIEHEFSDFTYHFIKKNSNSFVAAMVLRDQLKSSTIDTLKIMNSYKLLSKNVKNAPDAQIIATNLGL